MSVKAIFSNLRSSLFYTSCVAMFGIGVVMDLIGLSFSFSNRYLGQNWFFVSFYFFTFIMYTTVIASNSVKSYRLFLLIVGGVCLSFLPADVERSIQFTKIGPKSAITGSHLRAAGLIVIFFPLLMLLALLGSEKDSLLHSYMGNRNIDKVVQEIYKKGDAFNEQKLPQFTNNSQKLPHRLITHRQTKSTDSFPINPSSINSLISPRISSINSPREALILSPRPSANSQEKLVIETFNQQDTVKQSLADYSFSVLPDAHDENDMDHFVSASITASELARYNSE